MSDTFKEDQGFTVSVDVRVRSPIHVGSEFDLKISEIGETKTENFSNTVLLSLAEKLNEPNCADVEFNFPNEEEPDKLYAMSILLELRSTYFKTSSPYFACTDATSSRSSVEFQVR
jgi:hypothetical protein